MAKAQTRIKRYYLSPLHPAEIFLNVSARWSLKTLILPETDPGLTDCEVTSCSDLTDVVNLLPFTT